MGTTEQIAQFVIETNYDSIPGEAVRLAKDAILDGLGVMLAGSVETTGKIIAEYVKEVGGAPQAGVIGNGFKSSVPQAALANGTMAHALDYDDVLDLMTGHATVPVLPVVLALGEMYHSSGRDVLEAYLIGVEVERENRFRNRRPPLRSGGGTPPLPWGLWGRQQQPPRC